MGMFAITMIDDNPLEHFIVRKLCQHHAITARLNCTDDGRMVLDNLGKIEENTPSGTEVILLDLNMPIISGWDFLSRFAELLPGLSRNIDIYILSSSVSMADRQRAMTFPFVKGFYVKPMTGALIQELSLGYTGTQQLN